MIVVSNITKFLINKFINFKRKLKRISVKNGFL